MKQSFFTFGIAISFAILLIASGAKAADHCVVAEQTSGNVKEWADLYTYFKKYHDCDDGGVAEGIDDSVNFVMVHRWNSLSGSRARINNDQAFQSFLVKHVDEMWSMNDLELVKRKAQNQCPKGLDEFCSRIIAAAGKK